ncbi:unnamed protein product [Rotaria sordida]|uniref:Cytochrome P450 n=1 Tax=Rotaria sordida TaxID=392033 RepID=A0A814SUI2_9BILA|nr:unnamed protein product [Rotaria sordida]CAF3720517.1 unnamed protein product [Rotaria sordida]
MLDNIFHDIFFSSGSKWRRQRQVISPTFSASKLKMMSPLINGCINDFEKKLPIHAENGDEFNIYLYYKRMTMDVICRCAFGIDTDDTSEDTRKSTYQLTQEKISGNIFIFIVAGYETTSTSLAYATYELARHPDILQKLQAEIDQLPLESRDYDGDDEEIKKYPDYDIVAQMSYMDMFVSEVLRMYPIANRGIQRHAMKDTVIQGITIEKGSIIYSDIHSVHYDRELWGPEDPYMFYPERHQTKRHPMAYIPFGVGPRQCVDVSSTIVESIRLDEGIALT